MAINKKYLDFSEPIFYVTNDVAHGIGLENLLPNYHIICLDDHPLVDYLQRAGVSVFCLEKQTGEKNMLQRSSGNVLEDESVLKFIKEKSAGKQPNILFFKPQTKIEFIVEKNNFKLLGNRTEVNRLFEDKVSFFKICQQKNLPVVDGEIALLAEITYSSMAEKYGVNFVVQFGRGWAGNSTFFINSEEDLLALQKTAGNIKVKITRFIKGKTVLNNAVVTKDEIFVGPPALQIKSITYLTSKVGGTGGRQWPAGLTDAQEEEIKKITQNVGEIMKVNGYLGFFGLDFLIEEETGKVFLSENNARLTASVPFYTKLEIANGITPLLLHHVAAFLGKEVNDDQSGSAQLCGSEIVMRNVLDKEVTIETSWKPGIYDENLTFKTEDYFLNNIGESRDIWLTCADQGRIVNPEIELARVITLNKACVEDGSLTKDFEQLILKIRKEITFKE